MASRWYVPVALVVPGSKQTGNGRVRLFAASSVRTLCDGVGIICGRGICATHHLLTMLEGICVHVLKAYVCNVMKACVHTMFRSTSGRLGSGQVARCRARARIERGADGCPSWVPIRDICLHYRCFGHVCSRWRYRIC